jgi:hypothetical protein
MTDTVKKLGQTEAQGGLSSTERCATYVEASGQKPNPLNFGIERAQEWSQPALFMSVNNQRDVCKDLSRRSDLKRSFFLSQELSALCEKRAFGDGAAAEKFQRFVTLYCEHEKQLRQGSVADHVEFEQTRTILDGIASLVELICQNHKPRSSDTSRIDARGAALPSENSEIVHRLRRELKAESLSHHPSVEAYQQHTPFWNMLVTGNPPQAIRDGGGNLRNTPMSTVQDHNSAKNFFKSMGDRFSKIPDLTADGAAICKAFFDFAVENAARHYDERSADIEAYVNRGEAANKIFMELEQSRYQLTDKFGKLIEKASQYVATWVRWNKLSELNMLFGAMLGIDGLNSPSPLSPQGLDGAGEVSLTGRADKYRQDGSLERSGFDHYIGQYGAKGVMYQHLREFLGSVGPAYVRAMAAYRKNETPHRANILGSWNASETGKIVHHDLDSGAIVKSLESILDDKGDLYVDPGYLFEHLNSSGSRNTDRGTLESAFLWMGEMFGLQGKK